MLFVTIEDMSGDGAFGFPKPETTQAIWRENAIVCVVGHQRRKGIIKYLSRMCIF